ncbi:sugar transferase [Nocardioides sp. SYSU DS0651]|uniref:sugar transferase n=1 Tax=Nocardioides sp. SYSU DS0651 TaxID=3415955 RepID=UPI003F4BB9DA
MKRAFDLAVAVPLLILLAPLLALVAAAIRLETPGNPVFVQERIGRYGRPFRMYKFRSMVTGAEHSGTGLFSYEDDPRITRVGRFIRATSLDELPQLLNVIRGDMSIVGPRPPVTYELGPYEEFSPTMKSRFVVRPGITGLAQVSGRNDLEWDKKLEIDLLYLQRYRRWGPLYDLVILARTVATVVSGKNVVEERR